MLRAACQMLPRFAMLLTIVCSPGLACCPYKPDGGCDADNDCKGDRVCKRGKCVSPRSRDSLGASPTATTTQEQPQPTAANPAPTPTPEPTPVPAATPTVAALSSDGLPAEIPPPSSPPPTVAEWGSATIVNISGASTFQCNTRMVREWLQVTCGPNQKGDPSEVWHKSKGAQSFKFVGNKVSSIVVQVVPGGEFNAEFEWANGQRKSCAEIGLRWPASAGRPTVMMMDKPGC